MHMCRQHHIRVSPASCSTWHQLLVWGALTRPVERYLTSALLMASMWYLSMSTRSCPPARPRLALRLPEGIVRPLSTTFWYLPLVHRRAPLHARLCLTPPSMCTRSALTTHPSSCHARCSPHGPLHEASDALLYV
jgi:hypothetical protein